MIINENSILYFSGTGNTYDVCEKISIKCGFKLINVADLVNEKGIEIKTKAIGFAFPIYFGGIPKIIGSIINKITYTNVKYTFALATYGGMPGNPLKILEDQLVKKDMKLNSGFLINMPGNYIALHGARNEKVQMKNFKKADNKINNIVEVINSKKIMSYEKSPYIIDRPFGKWAVKRVEELSCYDVNFKTDEKCIKCGMCVKICPVNNIKLEDGNIKWCGRCEQCMACIQYCPHEAIQYGEKTLKRKRYRNPNVDYFKVLLKDKKTQ